MANKKTWIVNDGVQKTGTLQLLEKYQTLVIEGFRWETVTLVLNATHKRFNSYTSFLNSLKSKVEEFH